MNPDQRQVHRTATVGAAQSATGWTLTLSAKGERLCVPVDGDLRCGAGLACDVYIDDDSCDDHCFSLQADPHGLWVDVQQSHGLTLHRAGTGLRVAQGSRMRIEPGQDAHWSVGGVEVLLSSQNPPTVAEPAVRRRRQWPALTALLACAAVGWASVVGSQQSDAKAGPTAAHTPDAPIDLPARLARLGLAGQLQLVPSPAGSQTPPKIQGRLLDAAQCERLTQLRQEVGAQAFVDQVVCLPQVLQSANDYLRETGVRVTARAGTVLLEGDAQTPQSVARVKTVLESLQGVAEVDRTGYTAPDATPPTDGLQQQARARIAAAHGGSPGYVVTRTGEYVYAGGQLMAGVELVGVSDSGVSLRIGNIQVELTR